ncbi:MAG: isochorismatase family cysteine hydrolase [Pseudomonadales bacterium]
MSNDDFDGLAPDSARVALLLVDVINDLEFEGGAELLGPALAMAEEIVQLKRACRQLDIPAIYANDNFGRWQSDFAQLTQRWLERNCAGAPIIRRLLPSDDDYNILKPKHSGFYATPLNLLLQHLGVENLIITGLTTDRCVTFTAHDAYMRDYRLLVPENCSASIRLQDHRTSLDIMRRVLKADTAPWQDLDLAGLAASD